MHLSGLLGRDAVAELFSAEKPLEDEVRAALCLLAWSRLKELFTQAATPQAVDGLHIVEDAIPCLAQRVELD